MSDNKKYYYMRLVDNFYDRPEIKLIEKIENGYQYVAILLKMYLRSLKHDGALTFSDGIPYDIQMLSSVIGHDNVHHLMYESLDPWECDSQLLFTLCKNCHEKETIDKKKAIHNLVETINKYGCWSEQINYLCEAINTIKKSECYDIGSINFLIDKGIKEFEEYIKNGDKNEMVSA